MLVEVYAASDLDIKPQILLSLVLYKMVDPQLVSLVQICILDTTTHFWSSQVKHCCCHGRCLLLKVLKIGTQNRPLFNQILRFSSVSLDVAQSWIPHDDTTKVIPMLTSFIYYITHLIGLCTGGERRCIAHVESVINESLEGRFDGPKSWYPNHLKPNRLTFLLTQIQTKFQKNKYTTTRWIQGLKEIFSTP